MEEVKQQKEQKKCALCKKKLSLIDIQKTCKCGQKFCSDHFFYTNHCCEFNYKTIERQLIMKNNPPLTVCKVDKI